MQNFDWQQFLLSLSTTNNIPFANMLLALMVSFGLGMFIYFVYVKSFRGVMYSHNYSITFVLISMITSVVIMTISTNIVLSLGMVGALSIVRFRTAVKDPLDVAYMFWAIAVGIATGAQLYLLACVGSLAFGIVIFLLSRKKIRARSYLLVIHYENEASEQVTQRIRKMKTTLKSKTVHQAMTELTVEMKLRDDSTAFMQEISQIPGVKDVSLVSYNGDYAS